MPRNGSTISFRYTAPVSHQSPPCSVSLSCVDCLEVDASSDSADAAATARRKWMLLGLSCVSAQPKCRVIHRFVANAPPTAVVKMRLYSDIVLDRIVWK